MAQYEVQEANQRLDQVVANHYGSVVNFDGVLDANPHLTAPFLIIGDIVNLPVFNAPQNVEESLW